MEQGISIRIGDIRQSEAFPNLSMKCDVCRVETLKDAVEGTDAIVNLAAEHRDDVRPISRYRETNVEGAKHICDVARTAGIEKIVFTSTVAVYGFQSTPADENCSFAPFNEYGRSKVEAEVIYRTWAEENPKRTLVIVRPTVVFGEGNRGNVYNLLRQISSHRFLMVGSGRNRKSMAYVGNLVAFLAHTFTLGPGIHIFNYVDGPDMSTSELVDHIRSFLGQSRKAMRVPKTIALAGGQVLDAFGRITNRTFPISAIRVRKFCENTQFQANRVTHTGFVPPFTLLEGLSRTVSYEFSQCSRLP